MKQKREVAIIHFNTPELTEAAVLSIRKHGGGDYHITIFDNSDTRPFKKRMRGVKRIDNTQGQVIDFDKELDQYPDRCRDIGCAKGCEFGSAKHMMTVQKLWELLPEGFVVTLVVGHPGTNVDGLARGAPNMSTQIFFLTGVKTKRQTA